MAWEAGTITNGGAVRGSEPGTYIRGGVVYILKSEVEAAKAAGWELRSEMCGDLAMVERRFPFPALGFNEDHSVGPSREGGSVKRSHRAEGRNWVD